LILETASALVISEAETPSCSDNADFLVSFLAKF